LKKLATFRRKHGRTETKKTKKTKKKKKKQKTLQEGEAPATGGARGRGGGLFVWLCLPAK